MKRSAEDDPIERYAKWGAWALPPTVIVIALVGGFVQGPPFAALVLAAGAMLGAVVAFWSSIRALFGETPLSGEDAFAMGAPSAEEEQKRAVLRAIKDLEFERSVGKISEADYQLFIAKYRAEAKRLLRVLDDRQQPERDKVQSLVDAYLAEQGLAPTDEPAEPEAAAQPPAPDAEDEEEAEEEEEAEDEEEERPCPSCGTVNDADAAFCKKCGRRVRQPEET